MNRYSYLSWGSPYTENGSAELRGLTPPQHTRSVKLFCQIDTSAFANFVAVILYIIMFTDPLLHPPHHGVGVDLPRVSHPVLMAGANREDAMTVLVMRDGTVYFGGDRVLLQHLSSKILDRLKDRTVERVYIRADARAWYGPIKEVLDEVRSAGIERVAFLVEQRRSCGS